MKSILQDKRRHQCYLCLLLNEDDSWKDNLEEHHVFEGTADRQRSEKMGLKVYLCPWHHRTGPEAAHRDIRIRHMLEERAQLAWMDWWQQKTFGTRQEAYRVWMDSMGRNYVDEEEW